MKNGQTLLVLYSGKPGELRKFYELLGLQFQKEQHGNGPEHFACDLGEVVLEIYPAEARPPNAIAPEIILKVNMELVIDLICDGKIRAFRDEDQSDMKTKVLTQDPEGRRVELRF